MSLLTALQNPLPSQNPRIFPPPTFSNLQLFSATGQSLGRNFYWLSTKPDELDYAKTEWYYTPQTSFADLSALQDLPKVTVRATLRPAPGTDHDARFMSP